MKLFYPPEFEEFWSACRRRSGKRAVFAYGDREQALGNLPGWDELAESMRLWVARDYKFRLPQYVPMPLKWLKDGDWEDEPLEHEDDVPERERAQNAIDEQWARNLARGSRHVTH